MSDDPKLGELAGEDIYLDTKRTAARSDLSASYFNQARLNGDGPPYRQVGRKVLYYWPEVRAWLDARARRSTSETG